MLTAAPFTGAAHQYHFPEHSAREAQKLFLAAARDLASTERGLRELKENPQQAIVQHIRQAKQNGKGKASA